MKVTAKVSFSGRNFSMAAGQVMNLPEAIARDLISAGYADGVIEDEDKRDNTRADTKPVARKRTGSKRK